MATHRPILVHKGEQELPQDYVRVVCLSDTHCQLDEIKVPNGDILLHCGDFTRKGMLGEVKSFAKSMKKLPHLRKYVIGGNHDLCIDYSCVGLKPKLTQEYVTEARSVLSSCCVYLENSGAEAFGYNIWGSPYIPKKNKAAFTLQRNSEQLISIRSLIPTNTNILMTHCPPRGYCDYSIKHQKPVGCDYLSSFIHGVFPHVSVFGHIHEGYGVTEMQGGGVCANVAVCDREFLPVHPVVVMDLPVPGPLWQVRR